MKVLLSCGLVTLFMAMSTQASATANDAQYSAKQVFKQTVTTDINKFLDQKQRLQSKRIQQNTAL